MIINLKGMTTSIIIPKLSKTTTLITIWVWLIESKKMPRNLVFWTKHKLLFSILSIISKQMLCKNNKPPLRIIIIILKDNQLEIV